MASTGCACDDAHASFGLANRALAWVHTGSFDMGAWLMYNVRHLEVQPNRQSRGGTWMRGAGTGQLAGFGVMSRQVLVRAAR
jgi:hypothetical protein